MNSEAAGRRGRAGARRRAGSQRAVAVAVAVGALLTACGGPAVTGGTAAVDIEWRERQTVFRLLPRPLRLEAFALRGGIAPLGSVRLPDGICPQALRLDEAAGRLRMRHEHGSIEIDARSLRIVAAAEDAVVAAPQPDGRDAADAGGTQVDGSLCAWAGVLAQSVAH